MKSWLCNQTNVHDGLFHMKSTTSNICEGRYCAYTSSGIRKGVEEGMSSEDFVSVRARYGSALAERRPRLLSGTVELGQMNI